MAAKSKSLLKHAVTTLALMLIASGCTSEPDLLTDALQEVQQAEAATELAGESGEADLIDQLSGTAWIVVSMDVLGESLVPQPQSPGTSISFVRDDPLSISFGDRDCANGVIRLDRDGESFAIRSIEPFFERTCDSALLTFFDGLGPGFQISFGQELVISNDTAVLRATHFVSESDNVDSDIEPTTEPERQTIAELSIIQPHAPRVVPPEAVELPFAECRSVPSLGPAERGSEIHRRRSELRQSIEEELRGEWVGLGGQDSTTGLISVMLPFRDQSVLDRLANIANPLDLCLEVPPLGYYDNVHMAAWSEVEPAGMAARPKNGVLVVLNSDCGLIDPTRLKDPIVTYSATEIRIQIPIEPPRFGPQIMPCPASNGVFVHFDEPRNGRPIVR